MKNNKMDNKYKLFCEAMDTLDQGVNLINEYDSMLHDYGGEIMFQAESQLIKAIGNTPGITASELARKFNKSTSAYSQLIRKLKKKQWIIQNRNEDNNREYKLSLSEAGKKIYEKHQAFEEDCYNRAFYMLVDINEEDLDKYIKIQKRLNDAFTLDVNESKKL